MEQLIRDKNLSKQQADHMRATFQYSCKIQEYAFDVLRHTGIGSELFHDSMISAFQSMFANHLNMLNHEPSNFTNLKHHTERMLNAILNRFGLQCEIKTLN